MIKPYFLFFLLLPLFSFANEVQQLDRVAIDPANLTSLQHGAHTFINYCLSCHSANYMRYNRLRDIGLTDVQIKNNLLLVADKIGDTMSIAMSPKDAKEWFGVSPPDLSVEARARGVDWIYTYMRSFYRDDSRPNGWNNAVFDKVAMPHVLYGLQGIQVRDAGTGKLKLIAPGSLSAQEYDTMITDLTNYMAFMAEPAKQERQHLGFKVMAFLVVLLWLVYRLKKIYWKEIEQ
ncbi:MAG: cytochrome c1 [Methylophilaceae bacterium]|nr:cytochrome c1 [Methylophilaceae bacterium]